VDHHSHDTKSKSNCPDTTTASPNVVKEAEQYKVKGNTYVAHMDYQGAFQIQRHNPQVSHS
jgi:hypothetical protein